MPGMHPVILATPGPSTLCMQWEAVTQTRAINTKRFHEGDNIFSFQDLCLLW